MDKLTERIRKVEDDHAEEFVKDHLAHHEQTSRDRAMFLLGGFKLAGNIANALSAETMRSLIIFQEEKMHEALGFDRFAEFLEQSEYSPMSKAQFYERKAIFEKEGGPIFDLLNSMGMSVRQRKLLGKGSVAIDGDSLIIFKDSEELTVHLGDTAAIRETLVALADANADKSAKLEKQKAEIDKHDAEKREIYDELDRVTAEKASEYSRDPHSMALANLCLSFAALREQVAESLTAIDRGARRDNVLQILASQMQLTAESYGSGDWTRHAPKAAKAPSGDDEQDYVDGLIDRVFDENDAALAAEM